MKKEKANKIVKINISANVKLKLISRHVVGGRINLPSIRILEIFECATCIGCYAYWKEYVW